MLITTTTGARRGEVLALVWDDIDLDTGRMRISHGLERRDGTLVRAEPKTKRARRTVKLPAGACARLRAWKVAQARQMLAFGVRPSGGTFIVSDPVGQPRDPDAYTSAFRKLAASVGLDGARLHDCRHGFATVAVNSGVNVGALADVLGHHNAAFTLKTYYDETAGAAEQVAEAMEGALTTEALPGP